MKPASPTLLALLATRQFYTCDLYTFNLVNGSTLYYATGDQDIIFGDITYVCGGQNGALFNRQGNRAKSSWTIGTQVSTIQFDCMPRAAMIGGVTFLQACQQGIFDGATMNLERAFMPTYGNVSAGLVNVFFGRCAEVDAGRSVATFTINSHLELLNQNMPRNVYQSNCSNTLYDPGCGLLKAAFTVVGHTVGGSNLSAINTSLLQSTDYFDLGVITFTSGQNAGISKNVKSFVGGVPGIVNVTTPLPFAPASGDAFTIYPGCDKTMNTCQVKYNNFKNIKSTPFIPEISTAV